MNTSQDRRTDPGKIRGESCAVAIRQHYCGRIGSEGVAYFRFPNNPEDAELWLRFCQRADHVNVRSARVCSVHFTPHDLKQETQGGLPARRKLLIPGAVPSILRPPIPKTTARSSSPPRDPTPEDNFTVQYISDETQTEMSLVDVAKILKERESLRKEIAQASNIIRELKRLNEQVYRNNAALRVKVIAYELAELGAQKSREGQEETNGLPGTRTIAKKVGLAIRVGSAKRK